MLGARTHSSRPVVCGLRVLGVQWVLAALIGAVVYVPALALCRVFSAADLRAALRRDSAIDAEFVAGGVV